MDDHGTRRNGELWVGNERVPADSKAGDVVSFKGDSIRLVSYMLASDAWVYEHLS